MSPRIRKILGRLLLLCIPFALAFGTAELLLRVAGKPTSDGDESAPVDTRWLKVEKSAELGWIFPPDTTGTYKSSGRNTPLVTNTWGLRGPEVSTDTLTRRVLVLGDSYTFGWGMDDSAGFVRLLETSLRETYPETPVECINGGIPGYSIYQQIRMLEYVRERTEIHAVVATISLANDPIDELRIRRFAPGRLDEFSYELRDPASLSARFIAGSRLLTLADQRTTHMQFSLINTNGECRGLADESLTRLANICREANLPLVWLIVPRTMEIRPGGFWRRALNGATNRLRGHFLELADNLQVPIVDLKPALESVQARQESYLPGDSHWNEAGHQAVTQALLPDVLEIWEMKQ
ncbi:MAG: SGNH/GDSL hydrolase family protein [Candidatus Krumholzibacteria bacterium]|nr:SGNH/GDSL hydrolase family protein [Candidatus Krumholzibacteria bacterium]